jgi:hypothetical protein
MNDTPNISCDANYSASLKIKGIPKIIYMNHSDNIIGNDYMEQQFQMWDIKDYQKHTKKYSEDNYNDWKDLICDEDLMQSPKELAITLNVIDSVIEWYDNNESDVCIFMDDDIDLSTINNWIFDWQFLEQQLPYNWDCIQLYCSRDRTIKMHLHPWESTSKSCKCFMVTRYFAKRLKNYHYVDGKYKLHYQTPNRSINLFNFGNIDTFFYDLGLTYTLPIFCLNVDYVIDNDTHSTSQKLSSTAIKYWWREKSKSFSSFEFFHYNKGENEWKMEVQFSKYKNEVYMDDSTPIMLWI